MAASEGPEHKQGATRRLVNLGLLVGGFGIGQGSIFLAQTYLVARGQTELLALFGLHFSFAMLGIIAVEAGSLTILSSRIARLLVSDGSKRDLWRIYWETTLFRVTMAVALIAATIAVEQTFTLPEFTSAYLLAGLPALAIWSFNGAGFLDGLQKSGVSGLTGSIAYVASAVALLLVVDAPPATAGLVTGAALSIGYVLTVALQFIALSVAGWRPLLVAPTREGTRAAFIEETSMLFGLLPGQLYFRAQLSIASLFLGTSATAMLVYAKQIVGAASQISGFARRIEFPRMVQALARRSDLPIRSILGIQRLSIALSAMFVTAIVVASMVVVSRFEGFTASAWSFLALFSVTILTESLGQSLVQGMFARGLFHSAAVARIVAVLVAVCVCYLFVGLAGTAVFVIGDLVSHALVITISLYWLKRNMAKHGPVHN